MNDKEISKEILLKLIDIQAVPLILSQSGKPILTEKHSEITEKNLATVCKAYENLYQKIHSLN